MDNLGIKSYQILIVIFSEYLNKLFTDAGYKVAECHYVQRRTVNKKEGIDVLRIFVQGKFVKTSNNKS